MIIDKPINEKPLNSAVKKAKERNIIIPTLEQQKNPELVPEEIKKELAKIGLWDVDPYNLFRITWKNQPIEEGELYGGVNYIELPSELTGVDARIIALVGKWFPTGSHKVGATFGCLAPRLTGGQFDPTEQKAVWPSTGNYCRGGAYVSELLGCKSVAILPEGMSQERFDWLSKVAGQVIPTPGCESNVKEIFDKCWELKEEREDITIFNQFDQFGNHLWHYEVTGAAMEEVLNKELTPGQNYSGLVLTSGSSGTLGCGDYLKELYPASNIAIGEALQCPTLLRNGFGGHRIEGIGDKHVPWIHNVRNTDMIIDVDDSNPMNIIRLFSEPAGKEYLEEKNVPLSTIEKLPLMGISSVANLTSAIKYAKYFELTKDDVILTVFTDSMELYRTRLEEMRKEKGNYTREDAIKDHHRFLKGIRTDNMVELDYYQKKRIHNLKYFTWIEQQGKEIEELEAQWYDWSNYWSEIHDGVEKIDRQIKSFNKKTGMLEELATKKD